MNGANRNAPAATATGTTNTTTSYQQISTSDEDDNSSSNINESLQQQQHAQSEKKKRIIVNNFCYMSILFSANHACTVSCLSLATAQFAAVGAWQSGILYIFYTASGLFGATFIVKTLGDRDAIICGMALYCTYVATFWLASSIHSQEQQHEQRMIAYVGAAIGGIGAGFLWAAQGSFFTRAAQLHAAAAARCCDDDDGGGAVVMMVMGQEQQQQPRPTTTPLLLLEVSTNRLAAIFAFIYLVAEVTLRGFSSLLMTVLTVPWSTVFGIYALVAVLATVGMCFVEKLNNDDDDEYLLDLQVHQQQQRQQHHHQQEQSWWYRSTAAVQLLRSDAKMKYMIGLNAVFGLTSAFLNSYINGQVSRVVLHDDEFKYVGYLTAFSAAVAALSSVIFAKLVVPVTGKGPVLICGAICFAMVALPFLMVPDLSKWTTTTTTTMPGDGVTALIIIYALYGMGRATFESTLKAVFADFFYYEKEGAFANIILQNGLASAIGYVLTFSLLCERNDNMNGIDTNDYQQQQLQQQHHDSFISRITSSWCVEYHDGTLHNVGAFELLVLGTSLLAILGFLRASYLHHHHHQQHDGHYELMHQDEDLLLQEEDDDTNDPMLETTTTTTTSTSNSISSSTIRRK